MESGNSWGSTPRRCHWQKFLKAEPGPRADGWHANAALTHHLRGKSSATALYSNKVVSRTPQGDRDAPVLRDHPRSAADRHRHRNTAGAHEVAADRRQEIGVRAG